MPTFSFTPVEKKRKQSNIITRDKELEIILKNVSGIIHIIPDFSYIVKIRKDTYKLTSNSFNCKGKRIIYAQYLERNQRICIIRNHEYRPECNKYSFAPFAAGSVVIGNIVQNKISKECLFEFKKVITELSLSKQYETHDALSYWRDNKVVLANRRNECITKYYESTQNY